MLMGYLNIAVEFHFVLIPMTYAMFLQFPKHSKFAQKRPIAAWLYAVWSCYCLHEGSLVHFVNTSASIDLFYTNYWYNLSFLKEKSNFKNLCLIKLKKWSSAFRAISILFIGP